MATHILGFDIALGPFDVVCQKLWLKNTDFDDILGFSGHLTSPERKWAPVAVKIFYKSKGGRGGKILGGGHSTPP